MSAVASGVGAALLYYAFATPGHQTLAAVLGGALVGLALVALGRR